jgi:hypothetical protein
MTRADDAHPGSRLCNVTNGPYLPEDSESRRAVDVVGVARRRGHPLQQCVCSWAKHRKALARSLLDIYGRYLELSFCSWFVLKWMLDERRGALDCSSSAGSLLVVGLS